MRKVLVICTHNSTRSQMAEGLINYIYSGRVEAKSAGTEATKVSPLAIQVMGDIGIDISGHHSKTLDQFIEEDFDLVITVCDSANETCPVFPSASRKIHKGFEDPNNAPEDEKYTRFAKVRNEIREWVEGELRQLLEL